MSNVNPRSNADDVAWNGLIIVNVNSCLRLISAHLPQMLNASSPAPKGPPRVY
jgi:NADP-dependent 3-hydroxy acid dehydrogenase YdfG